MTVQINDLSKINRNRKQSVFSGKNYIWSTSYVLILQVGSVLIFQLHYVSVHLALVEPVQVEYTPVEIKYGTNHYLVIIITHEIWKPNEMLSFNEDSRLSLASSASGQQTVTFQKLWPFKKQRSFKGYDLQQGHIFNNNQIT